MIGPWISDRTRDRAKKHGTNTRFSSACTALARVPTQITLSTAIGRSTAAASIPTPRCSSCQLAPTNMPSPFQAIWLKEESRAQSRGYAAMRAAGQWGDTPSAAVVSITTTHTIIISTPTTKKASTTGLWRGSSDATLSSEELGPVHTTTKEPTIIITIIITSRLEIVSPRIHVAVNAFTSTVIHPSGASTEIGASVKDSTFTGWASI
mmetsp:Transcript_29747/g.67427  ORF Transcript_29747/g.67427 Transcript_29747/m.67427 type:complete len:208 (-) Transcript_29747:22-645(-)